MAEKKKSAAVGLSRIEIGFDGGQVVSARLDAKEFQALEKAVQAGDGWHRIEADGGEVTVDLSKVVFLRVDADEQRIGFTGS